MVTNTASLSLQQECKEADRVDIRNCKIFPGQSTDRLSLTLAERRGISLNKIPVNSENTPLISKLIDINRYYRKTEFGFQDQESRKEETSLEAAPRAFLG